KDAQELFDLILKFAGYGFNKSHSTGYAIIAYQTAYLKTYFPIQYMAAVLTYESVNTDKVVEYIDECKHILLQESDKTNNSGAAVPAANGQRPIQNDDAESRLRREAGGTPALPKRGVEVKPPDINLSDIGFTVVYGENE